MSIDGPEAISKTRETWVVVGGGERKSYVDDV